MTWVNGYSDVLDCEDDDVHLGSPSPFMARAPIQYELLNNFNLHFCTTYDNSIIPLITFLRYFQYSWLTLCVHLPSHLSCIQLFVTPWTVACQALLRIQCSHLSGCNLPFLSTLWSCSARLLSVIPTAMLVQPPDLACGCPAPHLVLLCPTWWLYS